ncbi:hypothetical protein NPIL_124481 [Nephila pilipes]|uniref:Uncharacterized protein n=1 Tax=Nephila pilipes TaxID=299642 RepID=A0A8X6PWV5_NEPPI|nr:hypothetical protein NPIL_124481 [Nephila pilipes]
MSALHEAFVIRVRAFSHGQPCLRFRADCHQSPACIHICMVLMYTQHSSRTGQWVHLRSASISSLVSAASLYLSEAKFFTEQEHVYQHAVY